MSATVSHLFISRRRKNIITFSHLTPAVMAHRIGFHLKIFILISQYNTARLDLITQQFIF